jgi:hypothetical protein
MKRINVLGAIAHIFFKYYLLIAFSTLFIYVWIIHPFQGAEFQKGPGRIGWTKSSVPQHRIERVGGRTDLHSSWSTFNARIGLPPVRE